jgi:hypothetical protein
MQDPALKDAATAKVRDAHAATEPLAPLFSVGAADELVAEVMKSLADAFSTERGNINGQSGTVDDTATGKFRIALRRYRSFFQRLLSL